jgi:hypothetical protein
MIRTLAGPMLGRVVGGMKKQETIEPPPTGGGNQDTDTSVMGCVPTSQSEQH